MKWLRIESKVHNDELAMFSNEEVVDWLNNEISYPRRLLIDT